MPLSCELQTLPTVQELIKADTLDEATRHGCCLAIAELMRRGLLPSRKLQDVLPHVTAALHYDVQRGAHRSALDLADHCNDTAVFKVMLPHVL